MTGMRSPVLCLVVAIRGGVAGGQVTVSYAPSTIEAGVPTELIISVTEETGDPLDLTLVKIVFETPTGLVLSDFDWLPAELGDLSSWFPSVTLPRPEAVAFAAGVAIEGFATIDLAKITVTADPSTAGTDLSLGVFADANALLSITDEFINLTINAGRSAALTVVEPGGGDGEVVDVEPEPEPMDGDGDGDVPDDMDDGMDSPADADEGDVGIVDPEPEPAGDGDDSDVSSPPDSDAADDAGSEDTAHEDGGWIMDPTPFCGLGMIGPGFVTLASLSVLKMSRRHRWRSPRPPGIRASLLDGGRFGFTPSVGMLEDAPADQRLVGVADDGPVRLIIGNQASAGDACGSTGGDPKCRDPAESSMRTCP